MSEKILVIGGAGYIGSHVTYELCDYDYNVIVLDNLSSGFLSNIDKRAEFINDTFTNIEMLSDVLKNVDTVIYLAALKDAGESMINPVQYSNKNIINSIKLINCCIKNDVKKFIFSSSAAVYGDPQYLPLDETHPLNPTNYYGFTKKVIEEQLLWYSKLAEIKICCFRYFNAAGYDLKERICNTENNPSNLLPIIMETAIGKRDLVEIFGNDYDTKDGTCKRDYIHVSDLASAHIKVMKNLDNENIIVNLATGDSYSVLDILNRFSNIIEKKINYKFVSRREGDSPELFANSTLADKILNWHPELSDIDTILKSMWKVYNV